MSDASQQPWKPIETAPDDKWIEIRVEGLRRTFVAKFDSQMRTMSLNEQEGRGQWIAQDWCPNCWTDGACWESNHDELSSAQPIKWRDTE